MLLTYRHVNLFPFITLPKLPLHRQKSNIIHLLSQIIIITQLFYPSISFVLIENKKQNNTLRIMFSFFKIFNINYSLLNILRRIKELNHYIVFRILFIQVLFLTYGIHSLKTVQFHHHVIKIV